MMGFSILLLFCPKMVWKFKYKDSIRLLNECMNTADLKHQHFMIEISTSRTHDSLHNTVDQHLEWNYIFAVNI